MKIPVFTVPASIAEAKTVQDNTRSRLILQDAFGDVRAICGVDVGYDTARNLAHASLVILSFPELKPLEQAEAYAPSDFPYVPGFLSFREIPAILEALAQLTITPDLLMVDGQGIAHPRRVGIGAHLGALLDLPSIGVAKSRLTGTYDEPGPNKGDTSPLMVGSERIGTVLRSRDNTRPLLISPGHRVGIESALNITQACLTRYRLPEPTRLADKLSKCRKPEALLL